MVVVLVQGRYLSFLPLCSRNEPVFLATCTPVAMPETRECVVQGATNVFTSIHSMDMRFIHIDNKLHLRMYNRCIQNPSDESCLGALFILAINQQFFVMSGRSSGEFYLGFPRVDLQGVSWYRLLHWDCTREAQTKHRLITQSEQERSCILLAQFQRRSGDWLWMHCVLQVRESSESNQQPVIVCTNQVLTEAEAAVMRTNNWLYHYYSVQNKLQYGLAYDIGASPSRLIYYPEHSTHSSDYTLSNDSDNYSSLSAAPVPTLLQTHLSSHHTVNSHPHTHHHHHHHHRQPHDHHHHHHHQHQHQHQHHRHLSSNIDSEPVDYSYNKKKSKKLQTLELDVRDDIVEISNETEDANGGLLVVSASTQFIMSDRRRNRATFFKLDQSELMDQWNPSPPWSDTLQKVPDLCHQELSPYIGSAPPTPTATPITQTGNAFSFDWMPEQYVPSVTTVSTPTAAINPEDELERQVYFSTDQRLFQLQPPPKKNHTPTDRRSDSADRDTP